MEGGDGTVVRCGGNTGARCEVGEQWTSVGGKDSSECEGVDVIGGKDGISGKWIVVRKVMWMSNGRCLRMLWWNVQGRCVVWEGWEWVRKWSEKVE